MDLMRRPAPGSWLRSRPRSYLLLALLAALAALAVLGFNKLRLEAKSQSDAPPPVATGTFRPTDDQWKALSVAIVSAEAFPEEEQTEGQIATADDVTVAVFPPFSGQVIDVLVQAGDLVRKGQTLATVKASELAQAQADLGASAAALAGARAQLTAAEANATRQKALLAVQGASVRDVQQATSDLATARATMTSGETAVAAVRSRLRILGYDNARIDTLAKQSRTDANALATITAPISGVVVQRQVGPGQYLNSTANGATTALFTISDVSKIWLVANVREQDAGRVHLGDPVQARLIALPGRVFNAKISYVAPAIDPTTHRLPVRAVLPSADGVLKPGMFANFSIVSAAGETAPAVPASAIIYDGAQPRVWVVKPDRSLMLRPIKEGRSQNGKVEVLSGLTPGERVVTAGALFIDRAAKGE
jgi:cobalt-zinc-cadmium efflux system membrane fusion protein